MDMHDRLSVLHKNGVFVYPVINKYNFAVCVEDSNCKIFTNKKTIGEYKHTTKTINDALYKTIDFVYKKLNVNN